ncbi:hypothetical protein [Faecalibacter bovis]|uniref:Outer membrane protein beta-barrel domain-containing protein n=1 Tax=Faecalibacter bovis TaxID=2898187 RepID=A0ABX7XD72_9FLAO|nr:hypothetical protein [Faecalibacter bovis]QTV05827.1 hypothetical protein J9309_00295 [Faecalibacter bovis]
MIKKLLSITTLTLGVLTFAQSIEFGPTIGYRSNNIVDRKSDKKRAVIGDATWNVEYGAQAVYNFKKPSDEMNVRLTAFYNNQQRGSVSERYKSNEYKIEANGVGLIVGIAREFSPKWIITMGVGLGYNKLDSKNFYKGDQDPMIAFPDLNEPIEVRENETNFIYHIGIERVLIPNKLLAIVDFHGDASISKMNTNYGSYGNQGLGFGIGLRYMFDLTKQEQ